jgi:hypothetical protein
VSSELKVDTISEKTSANGVTIDGVLIKDGQVDGKDVSAATDLGGLVHINTTTVASGDAGSSFNVQSVFSSTYTNYKVITNLYGTATSDTRCYMQFLYNTSTAATTTYSFSMIYQRLSQSGSAQEANQLTTGAYWGYVRPRYDVDNSNGGTNHTVAHIIDPYGTATYTSFSFLNLFTRSAASYSGWGYEGHGVLLDTGTSFDGLKFHAASGNLYGTVKVYGIRDS